MIIPRVVFHLTQNGVGAVSFEDLNRSFCRLRCAESIQKNQVGERVLTVFVDRIFLKRDEWLDFG